MRTRLLIEEEGAKSRDGAAWRTSNPNEGEEP
jgi:hypothetical protein